MKKIVELKNVSKTYKIGDNDFKALDDVNLSINKGEMVVVLGPSGAGKSTLLNLIGGMDTPTSGNVIIDGENISKYNENELSKYRAENVGFIFQFYNILPTLTVLENVELIKDVTKNGVDSKEAIKAVGLEAHMNKFPNQLSGGEQQRVSIARAISKNPKLLLCDEPTGALDSATGVEVLKLLRKQCDGRNGDNTVIIVTHNSLFADIADTVVKVKNGKEKEVNPVYDRNIKLIIPKGSDNLTYKYKIKKEVKAPIKKGDKLGKIEVISNDKKIKSIPLYSDKVVETVDFNYIFLKIFKHI